MNSTRGVTVYKIIYLIMIAAAPFLELKPIWTLADITNALMAFPNLIALLCLRKNVIAETFSFFRKTEKKTENKQIKEQVRTE